MNRCHCHSNLKVPLMGGQLSYVREWRRKFVMAAPDLEVA